MSKRFTDTMKYRKGFIRGLQGPYKVLWDYLYHECNHAGIWEKDFEIAQILIGKDLPINEEEAIKNFNNGEKRIEILKNGQKWFIRPFVEFQYGLPLDLNNRVHASVFRELEKYDIKGLISPLQGRKDKDKDKDKDKEKEGGVGETKFDQFWKAYPNKKGKGAAERAWNKLKPPLDIALKAINQQRQSDQWNRGYIPHPSKWINERRWEDEIEDPYKSLR